MEAGSLLEKSADLECWCYVHLHFFPVIAPVSISALSVRVTGLLFTTCLLLFFFLVLSCLVLSLCLPNSPVSYQMLTNHSQCPPPVLKHL